jgi:lysophospholipase L1-like esterase
VALRELLLVLGKAATVKATVATVATVGVCTTAVVAGPAIVQAITTPAASASAPQPHESPAPKAAAERSATPPEQHAASGKSGTDRAAAATAAANPTAPPSPDTIVGAPAAGHPITPRQHLRVVVVGDSITEMDSPNFDAGVISRNSWASYVQDSDATVVGGWAHGGATTADMLAGLDATSPLKADVLVIMAGNNDVDQHLSPAEILDCLKQIAGKVQADRVVLSTLAPEDAAVAPAIQEVNSELPALAQEQGWQLIDPMQDIRDGQEHYLPGMTDDGVHPSSSAAGIVGRSLHRALTTVPTAPAGAP